MCENITQAHLDSIVDLAIVNITGTAVDTITIVDFLDLTNLRKLYFDANYDSIPSGLITVLSNLTSLISLQLFW